MITIRDRQTLDLFDPWAFLGPQRRRMLEKSWARVFREHLLSHLPVEQIARRLCQNRGRPSKDLHVAIGVLILQQLQDLTDKETVDALAFRIDWQFALDLRSETDAYLSERTLRNYRRRVLEQELDVTIFRTLTDELARAFAVDTRLQRLDSTALRSAMRNLTRLGTVAETISKFLRELEREFPMLSRCVARGMKRRYVERTGEGHFGNTRPSESKRRLPEAGLDLWNLVRQFRQSEAAALPSFQLLQRVFNEQFEANEEEPVQLHARKPRDIPCNNVRNPADPDSSYNARRGQGYMAQVMETYSETPEPGQESDEEPVPPDLITHVAVHDMTTYDGSRLIPAIEDVSARGLKPAWLVADTHYGSSENVDKADERQVSLVSPVMTARGSKRGILTLEQFEVDENGLVLCCLGGHLPVTTHSSMVKLEARFDPDICEVLPSRRSVSSANVSRPRTQMQFSVHP